MEQVIYVEYIFLSDKLPSLLYMPDIILNGMDISVQDKYVSPCKTLETSHDGLMVLKHIWKNADISYCCFT